MYLNRIRHNGERTKKLMKVESEASQNCTFQPLLTENTQSLAQKYRQKIADNYEGGKITVLDILTAQTNKEQWIEETKKELAKKEEKECTFHPMTNENVQIRQDETMQSTGDKCFDLYRLASVKQKKADKSKEEYEFEKNANECYFRPNINKDITRNEEIPHYVNQSSIQKNLERMERARKEREFKKKMTERGYGDPLPAGNKQAQSKASQKRPVNYALPYKNKAPKASTQATAGSKSNAEETKMYSNRQVAQRRSPGERNVARGTKSSNLKNVTTPASKPQKPVTRPQPKPKQEPRPATTKQPRRMVRKGVEKVKAETEEELEQIYQHIEDVKQDIEEETGINPDRGFEPDDEELKFDQSPNQDDYGSPKSDPNSSGEEDYGEMDGNYYAKNKEDDDDQVAIDDPEGNPLLFVDVNLGPGRAERIVVYAGNTAEQLADEFTKKHGLDDNLKEKLVKLLNDQIKGLLEKIDEELTSNDTENHE